MSSACFTSSKTLQTHLYHQSKLQFCGVAAIAPWFCLRLPSCSPGFKSQALHLCFFQFVLLKLYRENNENKQKEAGIGPFLKKTIQLLQQINMKKCPNVHPVYSAGIRTYNLSNMSCHPLPLDQGFCPKL